MKKDQPREDAHVHITNEGSRRPCDLEAWRTVNSSHDVYASKGCSTCSDSTLGWKKTRNEKRFRDFAPFIKRSWPISREMKGAHRPCVQYSLSKNGVSRIVLAESRAPIDIPRCIWVLGWPAEIPLRWWVLEIYMDMVLYTTILSRGLLVVAVFRRR